MREIVYRPGQKLQGQGSKRDVRRIVKQEFFYQAQVNQSAALYRVNSGAPETRPFFVVWQSHRSESASTTESPMKMTVKTCFERCQCHQSQLQRPRRSDTHLNETTPSQKTVT